MCWRFPILGINFLRGLGMSESDESRYIVDFVSESRETSVAYADLISKKLIAYFTTWIVVIYLEKALQHVSLCTMILFE